MHSLVPILTVVQPAQFYEIGDPLVDLVGRAYQVVKLRQANSTWHTAAHAAHAFYAQLPQWQHAPFSNGPVSFLKACMHRHEVLRTFLRARMRRSVLCQSELHAACQAHRQEARVHLLTLKQRPESNGTFIRY